MPNDPLVIPLPPQQVAILDYQVGGNLKYFLDKYALCFKKIILKHRIFYPLDKKKI